MSQGEIGPSTWSLGLCPDAPPQDKQNQRRFVSWSLAWSLSFVAATALLEGDHIAPGATAWLVAAAPTLIGLGAIWSYITFVRAADELVQRIQLEALAWAFGAGVLFLMGYPLLERAGAPAVVLAYPLLLMVLVWTAAQILVARRFR